MPFGFARQFVLHTFLGVGCRNPRLLSKATFVNTTLASTLRTAALLFSVAALPAFAQNVIKIGEINSYKAQPAFLEPYKKGMQLAVDEINASGGLLGKKVELITRDDNGSPGDAVRAADAHDEVEASLRTQLNEARTALRLKEADYEELKGELEEAQSELQERDEEIARLRKEAA